MTWLIVACLVVLLAVLVASLWILRVFRRLAKAVASARGKAADLRVVRKEGPR